MFAAVCCLQVKAVLLRINSLSGDAVALHAVGLD